MLEKHLLGQVEFQQKELKSNQLRTSKSMVGVCLIKGSF